MTQRGAPGPGRVSLTTMLRPTMTLLLAFALMAGCASASTTCPDGHEPTAGGDCDEEDVEGGSEVWADPAYDEEADAYE